MATTPTSKSRAVRARLNHPVIDSDGHTVEFEPGFVDSLKEVGGASLVERYRARKADSENGLIRGFSPGISNRPKSAVTTGPPDRPGGRCRQRTRSTARLRLYPSYSMSAWMISALTLRFSTRPWACSSHLWKMRNYGGGGVGL